MKSKFDDIRPYYDEEIPAAMNRIADSTSFPLLANYVYPNEDIESVRKKIRTIRTIRDFQKGIMGMVPQQVIARSITAFTYSGVEKLDPLQNYLYVSNHRDIMLDACLQQYILHKNGYETSEITFGANLMQGQLVTDIGRSNKMFRVERPGGSVRDFYKASAHLSEYIRFTLLEKHQSVWIAQRNGRTKDGCDRTDQGIINMFGMSRRDDKVKSLAELKIVPISISYEWESCDVLKALELYVTRQRPYIKQPGEDLNSILTGIVQPKGKVHVAFCDEITEADLMQFENLPSSEFNRSVANLLDERICSNYKLTGNNFVAHDIRYGRNDYIDYYSEEEKEKFIKHLEILRNYEDSYNMELLTDIFLGIYSNPLESYNVFKR